jgi:hypothetical protein
MNDDKLADRFGTVLSLMYEFNWAMGELEISHRSRSSDLGDLRSVLADMKNAELIAEFVPGSWRLTKKGKDMVRDSLANGR